jgi:hypothetical protein
VIAEAVLVFFGLVVGGTGPAWHEWRRARAARRDRPMARVVHLPSAGCRPGPAACPDPERCAICKSGS